MKINRKTRCPDLWAWMQGKLPTGLEARAIGVGYGYVYGIYRSGTSPGFVYRAFEQIGDPVATVCGRSVELNYPEWYSDFDDLLKRFETETGGEVTLNYWECAKPKAAGGC